MRPRSLRKQMGVVHDLRNKNSKIEIIEAPFSRRGLLVFGKFSAVEQVRPARRRRIRSLLRLLGNASRDLAIPDVSLTSERKSVQNLARGNLSLSGIICLTLLPRFARHAVVTSLDQMHLRLSCPPFIA